MAVTALWAVHGTHRDILDYVMNPEKTENSDYSLCKVLNYAENDEKTEKKYFVTGINCTPDFAYERMTATKARYGKRGGTVAYHGYQSFKPGEVTPEQCHAIGVETAKRMWGDRFEVIVATYLVGSSALHNHFVVNSVSFKDGLKYRCQKGTHLKLRKVSDDLCRANHLSVIENPLPKKMPRGAWVAQKEGKETHASILRKDVDRAIYTSGSFSDFFTALENMGYVICRDAQYTHISVITEGWKKPVRLDYLGERYSVRAIEERLQRSFYKPQAFPAVPRTRPIECLKRDISNFYERSSIELIFMILFELMGISYYDVYENREYDPLQYRALSPCFRCEAIRNEQYSRECRMMGKYGLHTEDDVKQFAAEREQELSRLSAERQKIDNARRRMTDPQEKQKNSEARYAITQKMIIVRREKNLADDILLDYAVAARLVGIEMRCEKRLIPEKEQTQNKTKNRKDYER